MNFATEVPAEAPIEIPLDSPLKKTENLLILEQREAVQENDALFYDRSPCAEALVHISYTEAQNDLDMEGNCSLQHAESNYSSHYGGNAYEGYEEGI